MEAMAPFTADEQARAGQGTRDLHAGLLRLPWRRRQRRPASRASESAPLIGPPLAASSRVVGPSDYVVKVLLHGVTGPLEGVTYPDAMISMGMQSDEWIAAIGSYVRNAFGNRAALIAPADVARAARGDRVAKDTVELCGGRRIGAAGRAARLVEAHRQPQPQTAGDATTLRPWSSGHAQAAGMWLQIELPQTATVAGAAVRVAARRSSTRRRPCPGAPTRTGLGSGGGGPPPQPAFPRGYEVVVSTDGTTWSKPVAQGQGKGVVNEIAFTPARAKFVRIRQTGSADNAPWTIRRLRILEVPAAGGTGL